MIMNNKYVNALPLYRQEKEFDRYGISLSQDITVVGCFAHARRKFDECLKSLNKQEKVGSKAWEGLEFCNLLFGVEKKLTDCTKEERYEKRLELSKPILDSLTLRMIRKPWMILCHGLIIFRKIANKRIKSHNKAQLCKG